MGPSGNKQGVLKFMTLGYLKKATRQSWDAVPMTDNIIYQLNTLGQGPTNDLELLDNKNSTIWKAQDHMS